ncbi:SDR family NAD(P)-dependent oxidoreductase [Ramlibacter tataouinensis]|uniref:Oxidoreductases-like protein n=1 Tax=Ramlibacter tataouinensis (strain ATCC BAA-407 / DSM 14655 / LMG 21543 / TTB310) TaxID=365046 RepID=F5Y300_RAMTT|nr:SDR family NAD(P)-dependent oxidoreductase [Ramlibacter tataouinensis]AEG94880.1 oxidoreductases-like protein [Ramlibacter tataouinensis TTB310]
MRNLQGRVAAVTGAGSGLGRALAHELARRGAHLALGDVDDAGLRETAAQLRDCGVRVTAAAVDVAQRKAVFAWADACVREHGRVNLVFNNAGVALSAPADAVHPVDFEWIMGINFWGVVHGTQAFLPHLRASGEGHVVNISSLFGLMAMPTQAAYNASKFAVRGYTEALRMELDMEGGRVSASCVHPGGVATNIARAQRIDEELVRRTGVAAQAQRERGDALIRVTPPDAAARQILDGVQRNARRILVGPDARRLDRLVRLLGSAYQPLVVRQARKLLRGRHAG